MKQKFTLLLLSLLLPLLAQAKVSFQAGDVNGDGVVDVADIATVISVMAGDLSTLEGAAVTRGYSFPNLSSAADVNKDGAVDVADIASVISVMAGDFYEGYPMETVRWNKIPAENLQLMENFLYNLARVAPCDTVDKFYVTVNEVQDNLWTALMGIPIAGEGETTVSGGEELARRVEATTGDRFKQKADSADMKAFISLLRQQTGKPFRLPTSSELGWADHSQVVDTVADITDMKGKGFHLALDTIAYAKPKMLVITKMDGSQVKCLLKGAPQMKIEAPNLIVEADGTSETFELAQMKRVHYEDAPDGALSIFEARTYGWTGAYGKVAEAEETQQRQFALYNYRNDGDFNAWLNVDIDSITYSNIGLDDKEYNNMVVQEVWTPDSLYRIPLETIDSIGFKAPKPQYQDNVFHITTEHLPYIISVEDLVITFSSTLPTDMRPAVGQVMTSDTFEEPMENGFAGKIMEIKNDGGKIIVICDDADITDIFKKLVLVGKAVAVDEEEAKSRPLRRPRNIWGAYEDSDYVEFEFPGTVSVKINDFISIEDHLKIAANYYVYVDLPRFKLSSSVTGTHDLKTKWSIDSDKILEWLGVNKEKSEPEWATPFWPVVAIPGVFSFGVKLGGFLAPSVKLSLTGSTPITFTHTFGVEFSNTDNYSWLPMVYPTVNMHSELGTPEVTLDLDGKLFAGIALGLKLKLVADNVLHGSVTGRFGPEFDAKLQMKQLFGEDNPFSWYSLLKDSKIGVQMKADAKVEAKVFGKNLTDKLAWDWKWPIEGWETWRYLFPDFTKPHLPLSTMPNPLAMRSEPSRDVLMPVKLGMGIFDVNGTKQFDSYCDEWYLVEKKHTCTPQIYLGDLTPGETYTCRPIFNFSGIGEVNAMPATTFVAPAPLSLEMETVTLQEGKEKFIGIIGGWGEYTLLNLDKKKCSAEIQQSEQGNFVHVNALSEGVCTIMVTDVRSNKSCTMFVNVTKEEVKPEASVCTPGEAVDLGLPSGTMWANMNVGAEKPEDYGLFFAWGEVLGYTSDVSDGHVFDWASYKWMNEGQSSELQINKYQVADKKKGCWYDAEGNFIGDGVTTLSLNDDAARACWGGQWVMPNYEDMLELIANTTSEWTTLNGVAGRRFTSKTNGRSIFLPAAGCRVNATLDSQGSDGYYWSSDLYSSNTFNARYLSFTKDLSSTGSYRRNYGRSVRPVLRK